MAGNGANIVRVLLEIWNFLQQANETLGKFGFTGSAGFAAPTDHAQGQLFDMLRINMVVRRRYGVLRAV
ncbi:hypothetical protein FQZ97_941220 [compost metagenome]